MAHRGIRAARFALLALVLAVGTTAGCKKTEDNGGTPAPAQGPGGPTSPQDVLAKLPGGDEFAAGKKVYADQNCARCHKLGDTGGGGGMAGPPMLQGPGGPGAPPPGPGGPPGPGRMPGGGMPGPDLTKTGAPAEHTKQWLADHIRDAKKHKPGSRMPAFGPEKISDADLDKLAEYLASRK